MTSTPPPVPSAPAPAPRRLVGMYVWAGVIGLAACVECLAALLTAGDFHTAYERPTDRPLVYCQLAAAGCALLAMLAQIFWRKLPRAAVLAPLLLAAAAQVLALRASRASLADAVRRGGDWGALDVLSQQLFFAMECGIAVLCLLAALNLFRRAMRNAFASRAGRAG